MPTKSRILLVEDNDADATLIFDALSQGEAGPFDVTHADTLAQACELVRTQNHHESNPFQAALLDLNLPDSQGISTFKALRDAAGQTAIVVLSGLNDLELATHAVQEGAQDYLIKGEINADLLTRSIRYAVERRRAFAELERAREAERRERKRLALELEALEQSIAGAPAPITADAFGLGPLRKTASEQFGRLVDVYTAVLDDALDRRSREVPHSTETPELVKLAASLGALHAGPRDVLDVHVTATRQREQELDDTGARALIQEGRFLVLELMGHLVSYYRKFKRRSLEGDGREPAQPE